MYEICLLLVNFVFKFGFLVFTVFKIVRINFLVRASSNALFDLKVVVRIWCISEFNCMCEIICWLLIVCIIFFFFLCMKMFILRAMSEFARLSVT